MSREIDPGAEKQLKAKSLQNTFEAVAREWYDNQKAIWTEGYAKDIKDKAETAPTPVPTPVQAVLQARPAPQGFKVRPDCDDL
ncbi:MAG: hypothetical protein LBN33_05990 [Desulfovibrio sp.]|nr:hypothetical protein [Desulfovibrio sp.]